jgi:hypothetical protein
VIFVYSINKPRVAAACDPGHTCNCDGRHPIDRLEVPALLDQAFKIVDRVINMQQRGIESVLVVEHAYLMKG